uniref:Uncharacterized protein n=1 Tax=Echinococcus canadensis TaxID=519352 RepID=A0A915F0A4_9CEST
MEATGLIFPAIRVGDVSVPPVADLLPVKLLLFLHDIDFHRIDSGVDGMQAPVWPRFCCRYRVSDEI